jgi:hypothetical protein
MSNEHERGMICGGVNMSDQSDKAETAVISKPWQDFVSEIKEECLNRNFGTLSKSEFDLMIFHYYLLEQKDKKGSAYVSDYDIGKELGLTIQRVRSLREREALKQKPNDNWKDDFLKGLPNARCEANGDVKIPVPDVNVMKEVRNYLEAQGLYDEYHEKPKLFMCKLDALIAVCINLKSEGNLCKDILDILRESEDGKFSSAVEEQEHPVLSKVRKEAVERVKALMTDIHDIAKAGLGTLCGQWFSLLLRGAT